MKKNIIKYLISLPVFFVFIIGLDFYIDQLGEEESSINKLPQLELTSTFGEPINITELESELILIDFWFTRCKPCIEEMKYFPELLEKYKDKITIISISIDSNDITKSALLSKEKQWDFLEEKNPNWKFCNTDSENNIALFKALNISYYPTYFVLNKDGDILTKPNSGIYGVEKELKGTLAFKITLKKYLNYFDNTKLIFTFILHTIAILLVLLIRFIIKKLKSKSI